MQQQRSVVNTGVKFIGMSPGDLPKPLQMVAEAPDTTKPFEWLVLTSVKSSCINGIKRSVRRMQCGCAVSVLCLPRQA